ncbi:MAG: helix-turn-helix domain-containing protein [Ktedonobacteraceae bacterium]|nr:helix-turn-helix domain-containing protein [Ktedonobacteraceae bacterium]
MPIKPVALAHPNILLRRARQERGWSQQEVADLIEAPQSFMVTRWENGTAFPGPGYREKLCALFGKSRQELGLLKQSPAVPLPCDPLAPVYDPAIPIHLSNVHTLIGREQLLAQLKQQLCCGENVVLSALYGLPGVGKTTLAMALATDPEVQNHFRDGILWAGLGQQPDRLALLRRWGSLLGLSQAESTALEDDKSWVQALRRTIGTRRMLILIDDAWSIADALACTIGGANCTYLITTRQPEVAIRVAQAQAIQVPELSLDEGVQLLLQMVPALLEVEPEVCRNLVQAVGGLPLALCMMGNYLLVQTRHRQPRRVQAALASLQRAEARLLLERPQTTSAYGPRLPEGAPRTLRAIIGMSVDMLDEASRQALFALSVFPAKPSTFSEEAALAVAGAKADTLDRLVDCGLLEIGAQGRYQLHQVIADYARSRSSTAMTGSEAGGHMLLQRF